MSQVERDAKVFQIPLFPPLSKGDERGISGLLCELGVLGAINFLNSFCETITWLVPKMAGEWLEVRGAWKLR